MSFAGSLKEKIQAIVKDKFGYELKPGDFDLSPPPDNQPGHYGTNAAMSLAKPLKQNPMAIGGTIADSLKQLDFIEDPQVLKPGYVNFSIKHAVYKEELNRIQTDNNYFRNNTGNGRNVNIEFVSANPTGPLNVVSGRAAAYGDSLASLMQLSGYKVTRETYINDFGKQVNYFAQSIMARYFQQHGVGLMVPEEGYQGEYIAEVAKAFDAEKGGAYYKSMGAVTELEKAPKLDEFRDFGLNYIITRQKQTLEKFGVKFDVWFSEKTLHEKGEVKRAYDKLGSRGLLFDNEGATWFKTTEFGDDKDRVVKKSDGSYAYVAGDIAYVQNKVDRGANLVINILGPDHHGYVKRLESIMQGLGYEKEMMKVIILQQVNLLESGEKTKMSKRAGNFVSLDELLESVGPDAARYFFTMRNYNSHLDFDIQLAKEQSDKNPVYYVQYAYARLCNIFANAGEKIKSPDDYSIAKIDMSTLEKEELDLIRRMLAIPGEIRVAAEKQTPSSLVQAVHDLASAFHSFYNKHRVISDDNASMLRRLFIIAALKKTFEVCFKIIGITPRERM